MGAGGTEIPKARGEESRGEPRGRTRAVPSGRRWDVVDRRHGSAHQDQSGGVEDQAGEKQGRVGGDFGASQVAMFGAAGDMGNRGSWRRVLQGYSGI